MTDPHRTVSALLDRAAATDVSDPPIDELIRRGDESRRRRTAALATGAAASTAAVLTAVLLLVPGSSGTPTPPADGTPTGATTTTSPSRENDGLPESPTAQQLADGHWVAIAKAPIPLCAGSATAWAEDLLYVVSDTSSGCTSSAGYTQRGVAAAAYDPRHNRWEALPSPSDSTDDAAPLQLTVAGERVVAVSSSGAVAAFPLPSTDSVAGWIGLPHLPEAASNTGALTVVSRGDTVIVAGTGEAGDGVWELAGGWQALPRLPHDVTTASPDAVGPRRLPEDTAGSISAVQLAVLQGRVYAFTLTQRGIHSGIVDRSHLLRLDDDHWSELSRPDDAGLIAQSVTAFGARLLVAGSNCPPYAGCPFMLTHPLGLLDPESGKYRDLSRPGVFDVAVIGRAVVGYNAYTEVSGGDHPLRRGETAVWDVDDNRWLVAPSSPTVADATATAGTPYGFVVFGRPLAESLDTDGQPAGGFILRPAG